MSLEKRYQLVALARQFQIPIIEDDPYGFLNYDGERLPTLRSLELNWVFYTGSFSKSSRRVCGWAEQLRLVVDSPN